MDSHLVDACLMMASSGVSVNSWNSLYSSRRFELKIYTSVGIITTDTHPQHHYKALQPPGIYLIIMEVMVLYINVTIRMH